MGTNTQNKPWHGQMYAQDNAQSLFETASKYYAVQERELSYRFDLHQHPYVKRLMDRLLSRGIASLQAADTEYHTRVQLPGQSEILYLPDGAAITDGTNGVIRLTGGKALASDNTPITFSANEEVTVAAQTLVRGRAGTVAVLAQGAKVHLVDGGPMPVLYSEIFTSARYNPSDLVRGDYPVRDLDFSSRGAYAVYNWELFYHVPIMIALHLSKNQRFAEAQRWLHFLFDPTDDSDGPTPERFWKVRPFKETAVRKIEQILINLVTGDDTNLQEETISSIDAWKDAPFRPHVIARYRQQAYMYKTVMAYLDNLIAWGDSLFRQDTGETIDEALQLYVLAANILGPRPQAIPKKGSIHPQTYANLRNDLNQFGTVMRDLEPQLPFDLMQYPTEGRESSDELSMLRSLGKALYFGVPRNDILLSYWDTVADRLFKIRNSLNIRGIFRQLALFEPPIDPALLARAVAAGLDIGAIVSGLNQPLPLVRFPFLVQKAAEICQEVKSLGNNLLSAMEKEDNEALAILRAKHDTLIMQNVEHIKYDQWQEAIKSKEGLLKSLALAIQRYMYYERQLGKDLAEIKNAIPELDELDTESLNKMKFAMTEPEMGQREIEVDIAQNANVLPAHSAVPVASGGSTASAGGLAPMRGSTAGGGGLAPGGGSTASATAGLTASGTMPTNSGVDSGGKLISSHEQEEMTKLKEARGKQDEAAKLDKIAGIMGILPGIGLNIEPWGIGGSISFGGSNLAAFFSFGSAYRKTDADIKTYEAGKASKVGTYARREQDWAFQSNLAAGEITQIFKQLRAAQIREEIARLELLNQQKQIQHAEEIEFFLTGEKDPAWTQKIDPKQKKITNRAFYAWMKREVKGLYGQCFQFAFDIAKKAERALQHELGDPGLSYLQFGYLAGKEGLLAGEKLYLDIKRMEMAYHELNQREYELTKHVSLLQVNPLALVQLRATGRCTVTLPEELFDMDGPGHYFRRIKSVAVSIPCVTGPYTSVNCTLTLSKSSIRKSSLIGDQYARVDAEDGRFDDYFGSVQSIVISSAQNDSGLFETNLHDERYLPFENSGVISEWQLQLPVDPSKNEPAQFDYATMSDVVLHIRYTAREGGRLLRNGAITHLKKLFADGQGPGSVRLFSARHEFPSEWARFRNQTPNNNRCDLILDLRPEHYPFWSKGHLGGVKGVKVLAHSAAKSVPPSINVYHSDNSNDTLAKDPYLGSMLVGSLNDPTFKTPDQPLMLSFDAADRDTMTDLWVAVTWRE